MRLSVIVPAYNRERYIASALRSLLWQRDATDLDIIVIDDGSTDGTAEVVRAMMGENPCIRLFQQVNMGIARARNTGLRQLLPQTRFVSFLDSDDISPTGRFKADLACFEADPGLDLTYSLIMQADRIDEENLEPAAGRPYPTVRGISMAAGIYRRDLVESIGGFDEEFVQGEASITCCVCSNAARDTCCPTLSLSTTGATPATSPRSTTPSFADICVLCINR